MNHFDNLKTEINIVLEKIFNQLSQQFEYDQKLIQAMQYGVMCGGKRLRPILGILCAEACHAKIKRDILIHTLISVELVHAYSLVHDDLPDIDNDDNRRGNPAVWYKFDTPTAIFAGDALQSLAFENLAKNAPEFCLRKLIALLAQNIGCQGLCSGQMKDLKYTNGLSLPELKSIHQQKTGQLLITAAEFGTTLARANFEQSNLLLDFANHFGQAFQLKDDLKDNDGITIFLGEDKTRDLLNNLHEKCLNLSQKAQSEDLYNLTNFMLS